MTTKQLEERVRIEKWKNFVSHAVIIKYRNKEYTMLTGNFYATGIIETGERNFYYSSKRQALMEMYDECMFYNRIGKYKKLKEERQ